MTMTKEMNSQLYELLKAYLGASNGTPRSLQPDLNVIVKTFDENSVE